MTDQRPPFTSEPPSLCCIASIALQRSLGGGTAPVEKPWVTELKMLVLGNLSPRSPN